jgi:Flp pilus assembly pilin Flp
MRNMLANLWHDDRGSVLAMEWIFVASLLTLATLATLYTLQAQDDAADDVPAALTR